MLIVDNIYDFLIIVYTCRKQRQEKEITGKGNGYNHKIRKGCTDTTICRQQRVCVQN